MVANSEMARMAARCARRRRDNRTGSGLVAEDTRRARRVGCDGGMARDRRRCLGWLGRCGEDVSVAARNKKRAHGVAHCSGSSSVGGIFNILFPAHPPAQGGCSSLPPCQATVDLAVSRIESCPAAGRAFPLAPALPERRSAKSEWLDRGARSRRPRGKAMRSR